MKVKELILKLLAQDPDEIVTITGCENFYVQNDGPFLVFDEKVLEGTKMIFTSASPLTQEEEREAFKNLIKIQAYDYVLAQVVQNELGCTFEEAYTKTRDWIDEDDNFTEFISQFFYKGSEEDE